MQDWERHPEKERGEEADARGKGVGKDHAAAGGDAVGRAGEALVQDFVEAVEHGTDANDKVAHEAVGEASFAAAGAFVVAWAGVAVCHDQDAGNRYQHGNGLVETERFVEQRDGKDVGEKGGAVVDGCQVGGGGHANGNVPA